MNRVVYLYADHTGVASIYVTTLKSAKEKVSVFGKSIDDKSSPSVIEWLFDIGAVNTKTVFVVYDAKAVLFRMQERFGDEMEFVGLSLDDMNIYDVATYYDILATREVVPILENPDVYDVMTGLNLFLPKKFDDARLNNTLLVKDIFDEVIKRGVIVGKTIAYTEI